MLTPVFVSGKFVGELIFAIGPAGKINLTLNWQTLKILKKVAGKNKISIIMYWCGTRKFHPRTRIIRQKLGSLMNYSGPSMEIPCPTSIHMKDTLNTPVNISTYVLVKLYRVVPSQRVPNNNNKYKSDTSLSQFLSGSFNVRFFSIRSAV